MNPERQEEQNRDSQVLLDLQVLQLWPNQPEADHVAERKLSGQDGSGRLADDGKTC